MEMENEQKPDVLIQGAPGEPFRARRIPEPYRCTVRKIAVLRDVGGSIELTAQDVENIMAMGVALVVQRENEKENT